MARSMTISPYSTSMNEQQIMHYSSRRRRAMQAVCKLHTCCGSLHASSIATVSPLAPRNKSSGQSARLDGVGDEWKMDHVQVYRVLTQALQRAI